MREFIIADTHFGDKNIIAFENRPFSSVLEMDSSLIERWNSVVGIHDMTYIVGDFISSTNEEYIKHILDSLNGHKLLIVGNHDTPNVEIYKSLGGIDVYEFPIVVDEFFILSHFPMYMTEQAPYANIFAHVHNNPMYNTISPRSACVSAERLNYTPQLLSEIEDKIRICAGAN